MVQTYKTESKIADIEEKLSKNNCSNKTIKHVFDIFEFYEFNHFFDRSSVTKINNLKSSASSKLITYLLQTNIIVPVVNHEKNINLTTSYFTNITKFDKIFFMANVYTLKLSVQQEERLYQTWKENQTKTPPYAKWQLKCENCVITCYESGKTVFQGNDALTYASAFMNVEEVKKNTDKNQLPQAGSDEVGTGDYFGPVVVCASIVDDTSNVRLKELGVKDSKQLTDQDILKIAPEIIQRIPHSLLIVDNEKYNVVHQTNNLNAIKAKLHNQAYVNLSKKYGLPEFKIIDQFCVESSYYKYIQKEPVIIRGIHFETKAENKYISVGTSSIIARYAFLKKMEEMDQKWDMHFCLGAGSNVDQCAKEFVKRYGFDALDKVAKTHFKNTEKI